MDRLEELKDMIQVFRNFDARQSLWEWSLSEIEGLRKEKEWLFREMVDAYNKACNPQPPLGEARKCIIQRMQEALKERKDGGDKE